ncbi:MmgE/PrpD family protein [Thalassomonas sp. M1454]|uniref:MmgE/PrpD family protein n=1 Tax=Thalassomonas sp. M1454 TaxID=2594477 RepID=UPI001180A7E7|nr:MmgE/PrpD family protein [Thalassomonas sp. M1454]TRX55062.1 MmgE/PrpD family protein [Thalassomonas sp. M1454]
MSSKPESSTQQLVQFALQISYAQLPEDVIERAKVFITDSVGVGISGSRMPLVKAVKALAASQGSCDGATIWHSGEKQSAAAAAMVNAFQIHNQEWDCVHEKAVVHPMAVILSALTAVAEEHKLSGQQLIQGVVAAVEVATRIGQSATSPIKFFRPAICGAIGASAGIANMLNLSKQQTLDAMGIAYSHGSGTMQAHIEGSPMLPMQVAFNARNAINAITLAQQGFTGPHNFLEGPFGYFNLMEDSFDLSLLLKDLGEHYQICDVAHKPFPTGRAAHGTIDALIELQQQHNFSSDDIANIHISAPELICRLVDRRPSPTMDANYAKLCNAYTAATYLLTGKVSVEDFSKQALVDQQRLALAEKIITEQSDCQDPNAMVPQTITVNLVSGQRLQLTLDNVLGHPLRPLSAKQQFEKFSLCCQSAQTPLTETEITQLHQKLQQLEKLDSINELIPLMYKKKI